MDRVNSKKYLLRGVASITTVLVIVLLILIVAISITSLALNESSSSNSQSNTITAEEYAQAGARDALEQLATNDTFSAPTSTPYEMPFVANGCSTAYLTPGCATVSVVNGTGYGSTSTPIVVTSLGTAGSNNIEVRVNVILNPSDYGQIATTTWQEVSL